MPDKAWKQTERLVAARMRGTRNPLSGALGLGQSRGKGDVEHPTLFIEVKCREKIAITQWLTKARQQAANEGKPAILATHSNRSKGFIISFHSDDLEAVTFALLNGAIPPGSNYALAKKKKVSRKK
jgi:hypothetical protein